MMISMRGLGVPFKDSNLKKIENKLKYTRKETIRNRTYLE